MNGELLPTIDFSHRIEDGLILSFSNSFDPNIGKTLGKSVCIKILDMERLHRSFDDQLKVKSRIGNCRYVSNHIKDHFTKNIQDRWQEEYRIFWPIFQTKEVLVPKGMRKIMTKAKPLIVPKGVAEFVSEISPLSRLALCPCSSGRRFKHCHGRS
jgi:hypothetical protein